jgi:hypothetical protein
VASCGRDPEGKSVRVNMRYGECGEAVHVPTVNSIRNASEAKDTISATRRVPATLGGGIYNSFRVRNDEIVRRIVAPKQLAPNFLNSPLVSCPLLWRERLEDHIPVIAVHAHPWMIARCNDIRASDCRPCTRKHSSSSVRFMRSTKPLVRGLRTFVVRCSMSSIASSSSYG